MASNLLKVGDSSGWLLTSRTRENVGRVGDAINENRQLILRGLEENLEIPRTWCFEDFD